MAFSRIAAIVCVGLFVFAGVSQGHLGEEVEQHSYIEILMNDQRGLAATIALVAGAAIMIALFAWSRRLDAPRKKSKK